MDYQTIINAIQLNALNDPTPPVAASQEYLTYTSFINNLAIPSWENESDTLWNELWTDMPAYATLTANQQPIALPDDYSFIGGGFIRITYPGGSVVQPNIVPFPVKRLPEVELNPFASRREFYVYGDPSNGYFIKPGWVIATGDPEVGSTISFRYYRHAAALANPTDVPEMSDPTYIIYKVAAAVARNNYNMNLYQVNEDLANYAMLNMRTENEMGSNYMDDYVKDIDGLTSTGTTSRSSRFFTGGF